MKFIKYEFIFTGEKIIQKKFVANRELWSIYTFWYRVFESVLLLIYQICNVFGN